MHLVFLAVLALFVLPVRAEETRSQSAAGGATLKGDQWTPVRDASGNIAQAEWDGLPLNRWIELMDSSLESQVKPPYGAAEGYNDPGVERILAHYNNYTGMGWDDVNGRSYHFGGGHAGSANNMLTCFDFAKVKHSVVIPPTHQSMFPNGYAKSGNFSTAAYPSGKAYNYFPSAETPAGDDKPCASHEWSGIVFIPGINEVLLPRWGWFHAQLDSKKWRLGPQTAEAERVGFKNRGGVAFHCYYLARTGLVYMTSEGGQISDNNGYFNIVKYDPVKRKETGVIAYDCGSGSGSACVDREGLLWYFQPDTYMGSNCMVSTVNLLTEKSVRKRTACGGRIPNYGSDDNHNPAEYVPHIDKVLVWCTRSRKDEAQAGEMLEFDRSKLAFSLFPVAGTPPKAPANMNNKIRYWSKNKVLVFQLETNVNARVIKLAK